MTKLQIRRLIETIYEKGQSNDDGLKAIKQLAALGEPAIRQLAAGLAKPPPSELHPIDLWESILAVFWEFARTDADAFIDLMNDGTIGADYGYWSLAAARGQRSIDVLIAGLKHKDPIIRWLVAEALVRRRNKRAIPALLEALQDRSITVKSTVVFAMLANRMYDRVDALPALNRILSDKRIQKSAPGTWRTVRKLISRIRENIRTPHPRRTLHRSR